MHPSGAMFALGDASVRFISETVEADHSRFPMGADQQYSDSSVNTVIDTTWEKILGRQDGNEVQMP